jgi:hypothetical protein
MCTYNQIYKRPEFLKRSNIRWKILREFDGKLYSPLNSHDEVWEPGRKMVARKWLRDEGIHVFLTLEDAKMGMEYLRTFQSFREVEAVLVIRRVRVSGFLLSGVWEDYKSRTEVYNAATLLKK